MTDSDDRTEAEARTQRYELFKSLVPILWIAALYMPLRGVLPIARALAGKDTDVTVTVTISLAISLALLSGVVALMRRSRSQRRELLRLRRRCDNLEGELNEARAELAKARSS